MRIVLAPDKFKRSLTASQVCDAMANGIRRVDPSIQTDHCPMADGGEGTVEAIVRARRGTFVTLQVSGPLPGLKVDATFGLVDDGRTAVIEMSAASGLQLLKPEEYDPMRATTRGTGELICAAVEMGARRIILGIGGSATVDGGIGCAEACGLDTSCPLRRGERARVRGCALEIEVAYDVTNPLYGPNGAARVYGPQKGATPELVEALDARLYQLADRLHAHDLAKRPGAGAAGGLGFGMMVFFGATMRSGVEVVIDATNLRQRLVGSDLCLTGEGRLDSQSLAGKACIGVARLCKSLTVPCIAVVGSLGPGAGAAMNEGLLKLIPLVQGAITPEDAMRESAALIATRVQQAVREFRSCR